jgi:hypothetical protein
VPNAVAVRVQEDGDRSPGGQGPRDEQLGHGQLHAAHGIRDEDLAPQANRVQVVLDDLAGAALQIVDVVVLGVQVAARERIEPA